MRRDFNALSEGPFDLLVIGGGIYGAWTALDATLRGLSVALIDRGDWASGTSSASSKLIHGGLRYLEQGRLGLVRKTLAERRRLSRLAPHRVRPVRFVLPIYDGARVGRRRMGLGLKLYDRLAGADPVVAPHRKLDAARLAETHGLEARGLRAAFEFGDCQTDDARLTLELIDGAAAAGAVAVSRARAVALMTEGKRVVGASVSDLVDGRTIEVRAQVTACCAGAWVRELIEPIDPRATPRIRLTKGVHLVLPGLPVEDGLLISSDDDGRIVFLIPWYGRTLLGTTDTDFDGLPDRVTVEPEDVDYLLERGNRVLAGAPWTPDDVISSFAGLRTFPGKASRVAPSALSREWRLTQPLKGLLVSIGGKLTSARHDAAKAVDRAMALSGQKGRGSATDDHPLPWAPDMPLDEWTIEALRIGLSLGMDEETAESCQRRYGSRIVRMFDRIHESPELARRIVPELPFCMAEIVHAVEDEMALTLADVLRRRVPLAILTRVDERVLTDLALLIGILHGWSEDRRRREVASLLEGRDPVVVADGASA